jgi:LEA14-like dessication related protein
MNVPFLRSVIALLAFAFIVGCGGIGRPPSPPRVSLADIRVQEIRLFETVFQIQMRVFNTGSNALSVEGIEADLDLNGIPFARGVGRSRTTIPPFGSELVTVDVYSSALNMIGALMDVLDERRAPREVLHRVGYQLRGKLHLGGFGSPTALPFFTEGRLGAPDLATPGEPLAPTRPGVPN